MTIEDYQRQLESAGFIKPVSGPGRRYVVLAQQRHVPRFNSGGASVSGTDQELLWTAIRSLKRFTFEELLYSATTDDSEIDRTAAETFLNHLRTAGYFTITKTMVRGRDDLWSLKPGMNTGPLPPRVLQLSAIVWDPNVQATRGESPRFEEACK